MKKGIIVLLITVLAAGMVFAGTLTGSAGISFGYDLDSKKWGFENPTGLKYTFKFSVDTASAGVSDHTTNVWAEVAATAEATISVTNATKDTDTVGTKIATFKVSKANIHIGEDITIGILNAGGAYDYAAHPFLKDADDDALDAVSFAGKSAPGFTVSYKDWNGGFGAKGNTASETYTLFAHLETPSFKFAEDAVSVQAAAYAKFADSDKVVGAALAASYGADKLSASVAADLQYMSGNIFIYEVAANAGYDFVTLDVYSTFGKLLYIGSPYGDTDVKLDAKLAAGYTFEGDVPVTVEGYAQITDAILDMREIVVGASASATVKQVKAKVEATYKIMAKSLAPTLTVTYTHDMFKATAKLAMGFAFGAEEALTSLKPELSVESTKLVENATLALSWKNAQFAGSSKKNGAITASATIKF